MKNWQCTSLPKFLLSTNEKRIYLLLQHLPSVLFPAKHHES
jgi:hypothetical protein